MIPLFSTPTSTVYQSRSYGHWGYITTRLKDNIDQITKTYRSRKLAVKNTHFLVTALNNLRVASVGDPLRYAEIAAVQSMSALHGLGIGSELYVGKFAQTNRFFGDGVYEYIYLVQSDYATTLYNTPWQDLKAIRYIAHPRTDFDYNLLAGQTDTPEVGHAVIELDMGILAFQYHQWRLEQQAKPVEYREHTRQFIVKYPLANSLASYLEIAWVNSVFRGFQNVPHLTPVNKPLIALPTSETYVNETIEKIVSVGKSIGRSLKLEGLLQLVPTFDSSVEALWKYPGLPRTLPAQTIRWLSCLDWLEYSLATLASVDAIKQNRTHLNELLRALKNLDSSRTLQQLPMLLPAQNYIEMRLNSIRSYLQS